MMPRVCVRPDRRPVQVSVETTFTAVAPLSAVPMEKLVVGLDVPFHVAVRIWVIPTSLPEIVMVSCETVMPVIASGRAVQTVEVIPVPSVSAGHCSSRS